MATIRAMGLGGLDEIGKNMYVLQVNEKLFVLDAGYAIPDNTNLGLKHIIPNTSFLEKNKDKIQGFFISHGHDDQFGALNYIIEKFSSIPVYASELTIEIIKSSFKKFEVNYNNFITLIPGEKIKFDNIELETFNFSHSIPQSLIMVFKTEDGNVIYATDFIMDELKDYKSLDFRKISHLINEENLLLLLDSSNLKRLETSSCYDTTSYIENNVLSSKNRSLILIYEQDIYNIYQVLKIGKKHKKKIAIYGASANKTIKKAMDLNILKKQEIYELSDVDNEDPHSWLIITGTSDRIFHKLKKIVSAEHDNVNFRKTDTFFSIAPPISGNERVASEVFDEISQLKIEVNLINATQKCWMNPSKDDIKQIINVFKPKYVMPIKGYYKDLVDTKNLLISNNFEEENIIVASPGEIYNITSKELLGREITYKDVGDLVVNNNNSDIISVKLIEERKKLSEDGVLLVGFLLNSTTKEIVSKIDIQMRGVVFLKNKKAEEILELITEKIENKIDDSKSNFNKTNIIASLRKEIEKIMSSHISKTPIVIINIEEIE